MDTRFFNESCTSRIVGPRQVFEDHLRIPLSEVTDREIRKTRDSTPTVNLTSRLLGSLLRFGTRSPVIKLAAILNYSSTLGIYLRLYFVS